VAKPMPFDLAAPVTIASFPANSAILLRVVASCCDVECLL
jgi:hypothetical protein